MNKRIILALFITTLAYGCKEHVKPKEEETVFPQLVSLDTLLSTVFVPTLQHTINDSRNVVYAPTFLYAWNELPHPITVSQDNIDLQLIDKSETYKNTLNKDEYTTSISSKDSTLTISATFEKGLPFEDIMDTASEPFMFKGVHVKAFGMPKYNFKVALQTDILYYENDERFILKVIPKDNNNEIVLAKGFKGTTLNDILKTLNSSCDSFKKDITPSRAWKHEVRHSDKILIPVLQFNYVSRFKTLTGQRITAGRQPLRIKQAEQRNAFLLNENGAKVVSVATIRTTAAAVRIDTGVVEKPHNKNLLFNNDFILLLRKKEGQYPYFMIAVNNSDIMQKR